MYWLEKLNEMFEEHPWTDSGRVTVELAEKANVVVVKVLSNTDIVDIEDLTDFGIMYAVMDKVREMYIY